MNKRWQNFHLHPRQVILSLVGLAILALALMGGLSIWMLGPGNGLGGSPFQAQIASLSLTGVEALPEAVAEHAVALRPEFRDDLLDLADAPRYAIEATIDPDSGSLQGTLSLDYTNTTGESLTELVFRLFPNATTIYGGGGLEIEEIRYEERLIEGQLSPDQTTLTIPLPRSLAPKDSLRLAIDFGAQAPASLSRGYGIFNHQQGVLALAGWYPILAPHQAGWVTPPVPAVGDALQADTALYHVWLHLPAGYEVASSGVPLKSGETNQPEAATSVPSGSVTWEFVSGPAREFAAAISSEYTHQETQVGDVTLRMWTLAADKQVTPPEKGLEMLADAFRVYEERFGPYPLTEFETADVSISIGGYEFSGLTFVDTDLRWNGERADYEYILVHELAHQWWYGLVGNSTVDEPWLDEAHATYAARLYLEQAKSPTSGQNLLRNWQSEVPTEGKDRPPVNSSAQDFTNWSQYRTSVYSQGAVFLEALREELGDEDFFTLLRSFQETYRYKAATTAQYQALAEEVAGHSLDTLFQEWFEE